ncbi:MAG: hypothetical protein EBT13_10600 [Rhodobacteraceae bacterium]|nr:hypothetical protein [Paracoccaceae bacterium]
MKIEYLRRLAQLAIDSQDQKLMVLALEAIIERREDAHELKPPAESLGQMARAVRNLIAVWKSTNMRSNINVTYFEKHVLSKLSDDDLKHLFPKYNKTHVGVARGEAIEAGLPSINIGLHTDEIVCTHGNGRRFHLRSKAVKEWR